MNENFRKIKESLVENIVPFEVISENDDRLDIKVRDESMIFYENYDGTVSHGVLLGDYYDHQGDFEINKILRDIRMFW